MYWGNPNLYYVKLNENMISYSGGIVKIGKLKTYQEGPWFYKRNGHYYLAFASTCCPEGIGYAMSGSPTGPWDVKDISCGLLNVREVIIRVSSITRENLRVRTE